MESSEIGRKRVIEGRYEIQLGQLLLVLLVGILVAIGVGFMVGKEIGFAKGFGEVTIEKPAYCTADSTAGKVTVTCNELRNVTLGSLCKWVSPELIDKIRLVIVTS